MTHSMDGQTMVPTQRKNDDDKCDACPFRTWAQQHKMLLVACFGVLGVLLLLMLGSRKTVLNIANQPSQAGGNTAKVMVPRVLDVPVDRHRQWFEQPSDEQR
ncbi:hypothetical protein [uncultured Bifidobacterium sp.]|uniref:hypothetical protein n=1 Tax=uncultured Bifidobacterium sp. TaxID=165187 RepID=UPI0025858C4A|nr:hypothetical protein [uncultured Bifidobacterium sp.]